MSGNGKQDLDKVKRGFENFAVNEQKRNEYH